MTLFIAIGITSLRDLGKVLTVKYQIDAQWGQLEGEEMESTKIAVISLISLLGAISPGPDFVIVVRNCLRGQLRDGFLTALGVFSALLIHITYCLLGLGLVIQESVFIYNLIKYAGAFYLFYLGIMLLKEKMERKDALDVPAKKKGRHGPFISGFLCNLLNPKAMVFILSIFSQFVDVHTTTLDKFLMGSIFALIVLVWFTALSFLITHHVLRKYFTRFQEIIMKVMGVVLCALGIYIAFV